MAATGTINSTAVSLYKNAHSQQGILVMTASNSGMASLTCLHAKVVSGATTAMSEAELQISRFFFFFFSFFSMAKS